MSSSHTRLLAFPAHQSPAGGRLDAIHIRDRGERSELLLEYHELQHTSLPQLYERDSKPWEQVQGVYHPRRLRFHNIQLIEGSELPEHIASLPPDHPARALSSALAWRLPEGQEYYLFSVRTGADPWLMFTAQGCEALERAGPSQPITLARDWSPAPLSPARLVPNPKRLRQRYGGDPVAIHLDGRTLQRRLFIGGVDIQGEQRPDVHTVLNVGEEPSRWPACLPADRWENKGEGTEGMTVNEIDSEARWVIERLQAGQRILVHCAAGMNRSATICCAVLILLEGLSAVAALERVRQYHPWARPDSYHWLALRWLAHTAPGLSLTPVE